METLFMYSSILTNFAFGGACNIGVVLYFFLPADWESRPITLKNHFSSFHSRTCPLPPTPSDCSYLPPLLHLKNDPRLHSKRTLDGFLTHQPSSSLAHFAASLFILQLRMAAHKKREDRILLLFRFHFGSAVALTKTKTTKTVGVGFFFFPRAKFRVFCLSIQRCRRHICGPGVCSSFFIDSFFKGRLFPPSFPIFRMTSRKKIVGGKIS